MLKLPGSKKESVFIEENKVIEDATGILGRIEEKRKALLISRDTLRLQLNGIENQLFLIDQLLHPEPPEPNPDAPPAPPPDGHV